MRRGLKALQGDSEAQGSKTPGQTHSPESQVGARTSASRAGLAAAGASLPGSRFLSTQPVFVEHLAMAGPGAPHRGGQSQFRK